MPLQLPRVPIPAKLLLVSSLLALIPWIGLQYVRELERLLRSAQDQGLVATARAVATTLNDRPNLLLSGEVYSLPGERGPDLRVPNLVQPIVLDGRTDDWKQPGVVENEVGAWTGAGTPPFSFRYRVGRHGGGVYAVFEVEDAAVVLRDPARPEAASDHLEIAVVTPHDELLRFALDAAADGPLQGWVLRGETQRLADNRIEGVWRTTAGGYVVELRLPPLARRPAALVRRRRRRRRGDAHPRGSARDLGERLARGSRDRARALARDRRADPRSRPRSLADLGGGRGPPGARTGGSPAAAAGHGGAGAALGVGPAGRLGTAAHTPAALRAARGLRGRRARHLPPRLARGRRRARGPRDAPHAAHTRRPRGGRLGRGARVGRGPRAGRGAGRGDDERDPRRPQPRLREAVRGHPVGEPARRDGAVRVRDPAVPAHPAAARRRRAGGRRAGPCHGDGAGHERGGRGRRPRAQLRRDPRPAAAVHLVPRAGGTSAVARDPDARGRRALLARQPAPRRAAGAGTRLHRARGRGPAQARHDPLAHERGDAAWSRCCRPASGSRSTSAAWCSGCVEGYRLANPGRAIELRAPLEPLLTLGAPDLVAQLLDKLVDNALGFARPGTPIRVSLARHGRMAALSLSNSGPLLPAEMEGRLFESMVSIRPAGSGTSASRTSASASTSSG